VSEPNIMTTRGDSAAAVSFEPSLPLPLRMDALEAMRTLVAMRWFTQEPVPHDLLMTVLWAATRASSPGNSQGWDFLVVTDPQVRQQIADSISPLRDRIAALTDIPAEGQKTRRGALNLMENLAKVPVIIFVCGRPVYPPAKPRTDMMYSALYGATQNLMLAARAVGLGTVMTTFHSEFEPTIRPLLDIPDDVHMAAMIPLGWPARAHVPVVRKPVEEFIHWNSWG
jgi:nitroreductase